MRLAGEASGEVCRWLCAPAALVGLSPACPAGITVLVPAAAAADAADAIIFASADELARTPGGSITVPVAPLGVLCEAFVPFMSGIDAEREERGRAEFLNPLGPWSGRIGRNFGAN